MQKLRSFIPLPRRRLVLTPKRLLLHAALWSAFFLAPLSHAQSPAGSEIASAKSSGPVILWSIQRGCDSDSAAERAVLSRLSQFGGSKPQVIDLGAMGGGSNRLSCLGEQCAGLLREVCPDVNGQLIGGEIDDLMVPSPTGGQTLVSRLRVWRHDLASKSTFYQYQVCWRGLCGDQLPVADAVARMAGQLLERQPFEAEARPFSAVLGERLPVCSSDAAPVRPPADPERAGAPVSEERIRTVDRFYQNVYLALLIDPALSAEQKVLHDLFERAAAKVEGFRPRPIHTELRAADGAGPDSAYVQQLLQTVVARAPVGERRATPRLVVAQVSRQADSLNLDFRWLPTDDTEARDFVFPPGGHRRDRPLTLGAMDDNALAATLRSERTAQIARVRAAAEGRLRPAAASYPVDEPTIPHGQDACVPLAVPRCQPNLLTVRPTSLAAAASSSQFGPRFAQGALWSLFAASAASFAVLSIVNQTGAGEVATSNGPVRSVLSPAVWSTGALAALSLGLAIPTTYFIRRQEPARPSAQVQRACKLIIK